MSGGARTTKPESRGRRSLLLAGLAALGLLSGCSGIKTYSSSLDKNLQITTETDSGSFFSSVRTAVDIYRVGTNCEAVYEGTVQLDKPSVEIGLPAHRLSYLEFVFANSSFLSNTHGKITHNNLINPRPGYDYRVRVRYEDAIYNVEIEEVFPGQTASRELGPQKMGGCNALTVKK